MVKPVDGAGSVSPHSAAAQPDSAEESRSRSNSSGAAGAAVRPGRGLDARKAIPAQIMNCREMTPEQIQALIDYPTREQKAATGFNFEGNRNLTEHLFRKLLGFMPIDPESGKTPTNSDGHPLDNAIKFDDLRLANCTVTGTRVGDEILQASQKWPLMDELWATFLPETPYSHLLFDFDDLAFNIIITNDNKKAFMQALRDHPAKAQKIESLNLEEADLTNDEFAKIVEALRDLQYLDVPDSVTEMPDLSGLKRLKELNGENEGMLRAAAPKDCEVNP